MAGTFGTNVRLEERLGQTSDVSLGNERAKAIGAAVLVVVRDWNVWDKRPTLGYCPNSPFFNLGDDRAKAIGAAALVVVSGWNVWDKRSTETREHTRQKQRD